MNQPEKYNLRHLGILKEVFDFKSSGDFFSDGIPKDEQIIIRSENPVFQIVYLGLGNKLIAKFKQPVDAENYVDIILRDYIQFVYKN